MPASFPPIHHNGPLISCLGSVGQPLAIWRENQPINCVVLGAFLVVNHHGLLHRASGLGNYHIGQSASVGTEAQFRGHPGMALD